MPETFENNTRKGDNIMFAKVSDKRVSDKRVYHTLRDYFNAAKKNGNLDVCRFIKRCKKAGLHVRYYRGRFFWEGPAVECNDLQDVLSVVGKVKCQWDSMGKGYVVYPHESFVQ